MEVKETQFGLLTLNAVNAALNLIEQADEHIDGFKIQPVEKVNEAVRQELLENYPLNNTDLVLSDKSTDEIFGFLKIEKGRTNNELFALPADEHNELFDRAFSEDMIRKHYPHGAPERKSFNAFES